jgi:drug/metabolite transporter (DMT)-like permease
VRDQRPTGHGPVAVRRHAGDRAPERPVTTFRQPPGQAFGQPGPGDVGEERIAGHLRLEFRTYVGDDAGRSLPGFLAGRIVQNDEAPGRGFLVTARARDVGCERDRERGKSLRGGRLGQPDLRAQPHRLQAGDRLRKACGQFAVRISGNHTGSVGGIAPARETARRPAAGWAVLGSLRVVTALLALLASLAWGTSDFMGGVVSRRVRPLVVVAVAHVIAALTMVVIAAATHSFGVPLGYLPYAIGAGAVGLVALVAFYGALSTGTMGIVAPIAGTGAVVPVIFGIASGESPSGLQIAGIAAAVGGVILASGPEISGRGGPDGGGTRPLVLALVAAVGFGFVFVLIEKASRHSVVMTLLTMRTTSVSIVVLLAIGYLVRRRGLAPAEPRYGGLRQRMIPIIAVVGWTDLGANGLYGYASRHGLVSVTAVLASLYPAVTVLLARFVEGERMRRIQDIGVGLAMCGVVLLAAG